LLQLGHLEEAVLNAMKTLEQRLAWAAGGYPRPIGQNAIKKALDPERGAIRVGSNSEQEAVRDICRGLFVLYRNPAAHTVLQIDAREARAVVDLVDAQLVRIARGSERAAATALGVPAAKVVELASADFDGDGRTELLVVVLEPNDRPSKLAILKSGTSGYLARVLRSDADYVLGVEAHDIDGDGRPEVLVYEGGGGPGAWLSVLRWSADKIDELAHVGADIATFQWLQPDGDENRVLEVSGRTPGPDGEWIREVRTLRWEGGGLKEIARRVENRSPYGP
jgi:hypothetical protein